MRDALSSWNRYWFQPGSARHILPVRIALCGVILLWFSSFWTDIEFWFGDTGILPRGLAAKIVAFEELARWEYWSPLWWTESRLLAQAWILVGIGLAVLAGVGWGGRLTIAVLVFWMIAWTHRIVWLSGNVEPAIIAFTAYLIVEPGPSLVGSRRRPSLKESRTWQANMSLRLLQTHLWILLAASLLSQLAGLVWWRGEAVWWLASASRSSVLTNELLRDKPALVNGLTHAFIAVEMLALWLLATRGGRRLGVLCGWLACAAMAWIADYQLYGLLLASVMLAYIDWRFREDHLTASHPEVS